MRIPSIVALALLGSLAGCEQPAPKSPPPPPPAKSDLDIKAPGVDIKIDKDKAGGAEVDVKAPGADIKIEEK